MDLSKPNRPVGSAPDPRSRRVALIAVTVAALGYLVDIYDLILFAVVRKSSLTAIGVPEGELLEKGMHLLDMQNMGMLIGGVLWGVLGDKRGRLSVLFGSIVLYSLANIANGMVSTVEQYAWLRLIAGIGLAGELGAGITLVSELVEPRYRGIATTIVAGVGVCGALLAVLVSKLVDWRTAYYIGGALGLMLLGLRVGVVESGLFGRMRQSSHSRGNFFALFATKERALRYVCIVLSATPIWFIIGVLVAFSPEIATAMGVTPAPDPGYAIAVGYSGLALGDIAAGLLSQKLQSRRRALAIFIGLSAVTVGLYFALGRLGIGWMYACMFMTGIGGGYWAVFVTSAAEQFGTNLRATATTTAPNFVRGSIVLINASVVALKASVGIVSAAAIVGSVVILIAFVSLRGIQETFGKDLDFVEE